VGVTLLEFLCFIAFISFVIEQLGQQESGKLAVWSHPEQRAKKGPFSMQKTGSGFTVRFY